LLNRTTAQSAGKTIRISSAGNYPDNEKDKFGGSPSLNQYQPVGTGMTPKITVPLKESPATGKDVGQNRGARE